MDYLELSAHMKVRPGCLEGLQEAGGGIDPDHQGEGHANATL